MSKYKFFIVIISVSLVGVSFVTYFTINFNLFNNYYNNTTNYIQNTQINTEVNVISQENIPSDKKEYSTTLTLSVPENITIESYGGSTYMDFLLPDNSIATLPLPIIANQEIPVANCICVLGEPPTDCVLYPQYNGSISGVRGYNWTPVKYHTFLCS